MEKKRKIGTYVSRSVYTKIQMENKRLLSDIYTICCGSMFDAIQLRLKYKDKFKQG